MKFLYVCAFLIFLSTHTKGANDQCDVYTSCTTCIENADCAWKTAKELDGVRCVPRRSTEMPSEDSYDPQNELTFISDEKINGEIHITPQLVSTTLRPNSKITFHVWVKNLYAKFTALKHTSSESSLVSVSFQTNCNNPNQEKTNNCTNTDNSDVYNFEVTLESKTCSNNQLNFEEETIQITQYANDQPLTIKAQVLCSCPVEYSENSIKNTDVEDLRGKRRRERSDCAEDADPKKCINPNTGEECSGRGQCICGKCVCNQSANMEEVVSGRYCECDNFSCPRHEGRLCNGEGRGKCVCKQCICLAGWSNYKCSCSTKSKNCLGPYSGVYCTENGACVCGKCECFEGFSGEYCQTKDQ